ncbi:MAG: collagen binding domain-containing protein, partial [Blastocatellia bacterium]
SYVNVSDEFWQSEMKPFKLCTVAAGEKLANQDIRLARGGVITGRVTDATDKPVILEQVQLTVLDREGKQQTFPNFTNNEMGITDDRGVYRYFGLPAGRYLVSVGKEAGKGTASERTGGFYRRVYFPGVPEAGRAQAIEIKAASEVEGIDFKLAPMEKSFTVSGQALDPNGQPSPGAYIDFSIFDTSTNRWRGLSYGESANASGQFQFAGLLPGRYAVSGSPHPTHNEYSDLVPFEVKDEDVENLEIKLQRGATISGALVAEGVTDSLAALREAKIFVRPASLESDDLTVRLNGGFAQPDGKFQLSSLPPGKFRLEANSTTRKLYLLRIEHDGAELTQVFDLKPAEQISNLRIVMAPATGELRGRLALAGELPEGAQLDVKVRRADNELLERSARLEANQSFLMLGLVAGEYEVIVRLIVGGAAIEAARRRVTVRDNATAEIVLPIELKR